MTDETFDDEYDEDEQIGPSRALPPLYMLRSAEHCPGCGKGIHVYALGCAAFTDAGENGAIEQFHFLHNIEWLEEGVLALIRRRCPGLRYDAAAPGERPCLVNHCDCGAILDDGLLHGDVGAAFFPDTPEGFSKLGLFRLPVEEPVAIACCWAIGGGEHLDFGRVEAW